MRIACPACAAVYQVPDEQLRDGRLVRCARCGTDWAPVVDIPADDAAWPLGVDEPEPEPVAEPVDEPESVPVRKMALDDEVTAEPSAPTLPPPSIPVAEPAVAGRRPGAALTTAWVASLLLVIGGLTYGVIGRDRIMQAWPPSTRLYTALHLTAGH